MDLNKLKEFFKDDKFASDMGIVIESAEPGQALCSFKINDAHKNANGTVQGGAIFTLGDFAFAVAANAEKPTVSQNCNVTFLRPAKGNILFAKAEKISSGKKTCLYEVSIYDDLDTKVSHMTVNGFIVN